MAKDWNRLAEHVVRRRAELGMSQVDVAERGVLSLDRVQSIEGAKRSNYRLGTLLALERRLRWAPGSVEAILDGGDPSPAVPEVHVSNLRMTLPTASGPPPMPTRRPGEPALTWAKRVIEWAQQTGPESPADEEVAEMIARAVKLGRRAG